MRPIRPAAPLLLVLAAAECSAPGGVGLDRAAVLNATYALPSGKAVRVVDGRWSDPAPGGRESLRVTDLGVRDDLDGDGAADALVTLAYAGGGSGTFLYLAAVHNEGGRPGGVALAELGDRVKVESVRAAGGIVTVELVVHGQNDPLCCPSQHVTRTFRLTGGGLVAG